MSRGFAAGLPVVRHGERLSEPGSQPEQRRRPAERLAASWRLWGLAAFEIAMLNGTDLLPAFPQRLQFPPQRDTKLEEL
jgi:hypothetical protein